MELRSRTDHAPRPYRQAVARGIWDWALDRLGLVAIVMPWRQVYIKAAWWECETLKRHEAWHIAQIDRDGPVRFTAKYLYWLAKHGYRRNPYEREAYLNQSKYPPGYHPDELHAPMEAHGADEEAQMGHEAMRSMRA